MKIKILLSSVLSVFVLAFIFSKPPANVNNTPPAPPPPTSGNIRLGYEEQKERLEYLLSGQINKYECESDYNKIGTGSVIEDNSLFGNEAKVIYCNARADKAGYVVKGLNRYDVVVGIKNKWLNDTMHNWQVRPRIRINQDLIYPLISGYNEENLHTKICRLEIVNTEGKVVRKVEYEAKHFLEKHPDDECKVYYSGNYRESFGYLFSFDSLIIINGKDLNPKCKTGIKNNKLDYRLYWYGYTDMWVDYIKVENDAAVDLLNGRYDVWLKAMDRINIEDINNIKINSNQRVCFDYIINKLKELNLALK